MTYNNGFICKYTIYPDGRVSWNHGGAGGMLAWESDGVYTLTGVHSKAKIERITKVDDKSIKVDHYQSPEKMAAHTGNIAGKGIRIGDL